MDKQPGIITVNPRQSPQEIPTAITLGSVVPRVLQLIAGPKNSSFRAAVEPFRIKQGPLIMVAQQAHRAVVDHRIQTFTRIWTVADNVTQAVNLLNGLAMDMRKNSLKSFIIAMNVADDGAFQ